MSTLVDESAWAEAWQRSWDRQQEGYMPDREARLAALVDVVEAVSGPAPRVLDLACGTGSISRRLLDRLPGARSVAVDVDPALLTIARATFAGDERVRLVRADLGDPGWLDALREGGFDAVVSATALHWLAEPVLRRVYRDLHGLVRP
ncbi:MAG TPA: class I SAM-dependent methyltransferase, partial [Acidimicrobiales bacterium]